MSPPSESLPDRGPRNTLLAYPLNLDSSDDIYFDHQVYTQGVPQLCRIPEGIIPTITEL